MISHQSAVKMLKIMKFFHITMKAVSTFLPGIAKVYNAQSNCKMYSNFCVYGVVLKIHYCKNDSTNKSYISQSINQP
jgi:hypothetical protein